MHNYCILIQRACSGGCGHCMFNRHACDNYANHHIMIPALCFSACILETKSQVLLNAVIVECWGGVYIMAFRS